LAALRARIRFRLAADVILATFFVSHLTPFGSATGTLVNASALEADGIAGFGTPRAVAVLAVLGYRIINYWLPLIPGAIAYIRLRLRPGAAG
jgi:uncharacterized membrane protein YbhN (UPF0104 family)